MGKKLAVLASGTGSLFKAIHQAGIPIDLFMADRACPALRYAEDQNIPSDCLRRTFGPDFQRTAYTADVYGVLRNHKIDLVAMAGYMTVFAPVMFADGMYKGKILNTHPSLLPSFKGDHAVRDALKFGVKVTGCTIHWATEELDDGPIMFQEAVRVYNDDTVESLHERIKEIERVAYPKLLKDLMGL